MKKTRIAIIIALVMALTVTVIAMVSCGKKETKNTTAVKTASDGNSSSDEAPKTVVKEEVTTEELKTDDITVDNETGELVVNIDSDNVELVENDNGEKAVIITDDKTGEKTTVAVKEGNDGKIVVDNSKQASVDNKTGEVKVTNTPAPTSTEKAGTTKTETKVIVDDSGNVSIVKEKTVTVTVTVTPTSVPAQKTPTSSAEPTSSVKQATATPVPVLTSKPTSTPVPTKAPTSTPVPTSTPKPTSTPVPTATTAPAACTHVGGVYSIYTKKLVPAYDEAVMMTVQTNECRGCGQYARDFEIAYDTHNTSKLVEMYLVGQPQIAVDNLNKFVNENPNWIYENFDDGYDFFVGHCSGCNGGSSWGTVYIEVPTGEVIHHNATYVAGNFIGTYCIKCNSWLWDEGGVAAAAAARYGITTINSDTVYMKFQY